MCRHLFRCRFAYFNSLSLMFESRIPHTTRSRSNESSRSAKLQDEASSFNSVKNFSNVFSGSWFLVKNLNRSILFHSLSDGNIRRRRRIILPRFGPFLRSTLWQSLISKRLIISKFVSFIKEKSIGGFYQLEYTTDTMFYFIFIRLNPKIDKDSKLPLTKFIAFQNTSFPY